MTKNLLLKQLLISALFISVSCRKQSIHSNTGILPAPAQTPSLREEEVAVKTADWIVYPYFGGPGEDSMYCVWSPFLPNYYQSKNLISVRIKKKGGTIVTAREFISVSQKEDGYLYQAGNLLGMPSKVLFWWIQKSTGTVPDADSAFVKFKY